jgi:exopolyphosphatase/guanosine-5'-triphosphate,3'-diphosphate pyrophosphatase
MKRIGIIDIGSNSLRLVMYEVSIKGNYKVLDILKESVRLGADMLNGIKLSDDRIVKALTTLKGFKNLCDAAGVSEIIAVATEAVRKAENKKEFLQKIKEATGIDVRVLTGDEEVYYDYLGVVNSLNIKNSLMIDLGGSSTEIAWISGRELKESAIIPFGAVNLTQMFQTEDLIGPLQEEKLRVFIKEKFKEIPWLLEVNFDNIIGIGGTIRNIGKIDRHNKRYPLDIHHNYEIANIDVHNVYNIIKSKSLKQRFKVEGLSKERADIFVAPVCFVDTLLSLLNIEKLTVSGKGLREGLMYEYITDNCVEIEDILEFSITNVMRNRNVNIQHAQTVFKFAKILFDKLQNIHHLETSFNKILKTAALLHDSGLNVRFYDHHKHSFYMILNSEILGLTHKEILMSAFSAAFHENTLFEGNIFQFHGIINKMDLNIAEKIGVLIRIAECLDKSMTGAVKDIECTIDEENVTLDIISETNIDLEKNYAQRCSDNFYKIYDRHLIIK